MYIHRIYYLYITLSSNYSLLASLCVFKLQLTSNFISTVLPMRMCIPTEGLAHHTYIKNAIKKIIT